MNVILILLYIVGLYSPSLAGSLQLRTQRLNAQYSQTSPHIKRKLPWATLVMTAAIAVPTTLQFFIPSLLAWFQRDAARFVVGEWWRIITPLFVQDGGMGGSIFNLVTLLFVGSVAEWWWGSRRWLLIFFTGGVIGEWVALAWQPVGAGNSVANFGLAASVAVGCLMGPPSKRVQVAAFLALGADIILVGFKDIHGAAAIAGGLLAFLLSRWRTPKNAQAVKNKLLIL